MGNYQVGRRAPLKFEPLGPFQGILETSTSQLSKWPLIQLSAELGDWSVLWSWS